MLQQAEGHHDWRGLPQSRNQRRDVLYGRKKYAGLMPSKMRRLRQIEDEDAKLKHLVADLSLNKAMFQDVVSRKL